MKGGKREGAGRKPIDGDAAMATYQARLTGRQARKARRIGEGNVSEGIRRAIEEYKEVKIDTNL